MSGNIPADARPRRLALQAFALMFIGVLVGWRRDWFASLGALSGIVQWGTFAAVCIFALGRRTFGWSRPKHFAILCAGCLTLLFLNVGTGSKYYIMMSIFPLMWPFLKKGALRKMLPIACIVAFIIYIYVVAPGVTMSRGLLEVGRDNPREQIYHTMRHGSGETADGGTVQVQDFLFRQYPAIPMSFLVGQVNQFGFQRGKTMDYALYALIPRVLWPDKPNVTRGAWFTAYLGFSVSEESATTSTGITAAGELYWNFGIAGLAMGMFLIGILKGYLWSIAGDNPLTTPFLMLLYVFLTFTMPDMPEAVTVGVSAIYCIALFGVVRIIYSRISWRHRSSPHLLGQKNRGDERHEVQPGKTTAGN